MVTKARPRGPDRRKVFVSYGRDERLRRAMFTFLRAIGLKPLEFSVAVTSVGKAAPYIGEILDSAFTNARAVVVLLTPDDEARLRAELLDDTDQFYERNLAHQARPNVLFEAGMALGRCPNRTVIVEVGTLRPFSNIAGRHVIRLTNTPKSRQQLANRLKVAGCLVDLSGTDWHDAGDFSPLPQLEHEIETGDSGSALASFRLQAKEIAILRHLAQDNGEDDRTVYGLASATDMTQQRVIHHLERLQERDFVTPIMVMGREHVWELTARARTYLVRKKML